MERARASGIRPVTATAAVITLVLIIAMWTVLAFNVRADRDNEEAGYKRGVGNLVRTFAEHTLRTFDLIDEVLVSLQRQHASRGGVSFAAHEGRYKDLVRGLARTDSQGNVVDATIRSFMGANVADRPYFGRLRESTEDVVVVGETIRGRATGEVLLPVARRLVDARGRFEGMVVVAIDPDYFARFFEDLNLGARGLIAIAGVDGKIRAHRAHYALPLGFDASGSAIHRSATAISEGYAALTGPYDGREVLYAFRQVLKYQLVTVIGTATDEVFAEWRTRTRDRIVRAAIATVVLLCASAVLVALARRVDRDREREILANRLKSRFVAQVSHELRTPLHGILGFARYMEKRVDDASLRESAAHIRAGGEHLLALVEALLDLAKMEAGKLDLAPVDTDVAGLLDEVSAQHRMVAAGKGLRFDVVVADAARGRFVCDATRLRSMLNNLIHNAVKFTSTGSVAIHLERRGADLVFRVEDTGRGISPEDQAIIFERFRQGADDRDELAGGWGLGLALVRELTERMGGTVRVVSSPGIGTTFTLELPLPPARPASAERTMANADSAIIATS